MSLRKSLLASALVFVAACGVAQGPSETVKAPEVQPGTKQPPDAPVPAEIAAALAAPDRSEADKALDAGRKADEMLAFFGIKPGMTVVELGAGGGYTAELLARVVGPSGKVYGQNTK